MAIACTLQCVAVQKVWDTDRRDTVWDDNPYLLFAWFAQLHIPGISKSFSFNNKQNALKAHLIYLKIHKMYAYTKRAPFQKGRTTKRAQKAFQVLHKYIQQARGT